MPKPKRIENRVVRVPEAVYEQIKRWSNLTGRPISDVLARELGARAEVFFEGYAAGLRDGRLGEAH